MNDIFTVIVDKRLMQAVEYVKSRGGTRPEEIWQNVARYMNGITPEQCSERFNYLVTEKQYTPLDYRPKTAMPDEELQVTIIDNDKRESMNIPRMLLVNNMAYFQRILSNKESSAIDLSIHSDICVFKWLIQYCYHLYQPTEYPAATLTIKIVFPVMVSAHFLGMPNLVHECLKFMLLGSNFTQILSFNYDLSYMETDLLKKFMDLAPLALFIRNIGRNYNNYLILKITNASTHALLHKFSDKVVICERCGYFCLQEVLGSAALAKQSPRSTFLNCSKGSSHIDGRGRMTSYHEFRSCTRLSKAIQKHLASLKLYPKLTSMQVYWALFGLLFWCSCSNCGQVFPLRELYTCMASSNQQTSHVIDKVLVAPSDNDLRLTIKEDVFDLNKVVWNNLSIKARLLNLLDTPVICEMVALHKPDSHMPSSTMSPSSKVDAMPVPQVSIDAIAKTSKSSIRDDVITTSAEIMVESEDSDDKANTFSQARSSGPFMPVKRQISPNQSLPSKLPTPFRVQKSPNPSFTTNALRAKSQSFEAIPRAQDPNDSIDSQDSNDCNELQTKVFSRVVDDDGSTKGKSLSRNLPDRYRRYLKLKGAMTDMQRKSILTDIAHEEDVLKIRAMNNALITAREKDMVKRARYAFESIAFPTYNFQSRGK